MIFIKKFENFVTRKINKNIQDSFFREGDSYGELFDNNKKIGYFHYRIDKSNNTLNLVEISVENEFKGMKYGYKIMNEVIKVAKKSNMNKIILEVLSTNSIALNLYKNLGFKEYDRESFFIKMYLDV